MGSSMENRAPRFDTSQPGVRQLQSWIRERTPLAIQLIDGSSTNGVPRWVDAEYVGLEPANGGELILVARQAMALIRPLL